MNRRGPLRLDEPAGRWFSWRAVIVGIGAWLLIVSLIELGGLWRTRAVLYAVIPALCAPVAIWLTRRQRIVVGEHEVRVSVGWQRELVIDRDRINAVTFDKLTALVLDEGVVVVEALSGNGSGYLPRAVSLAKLLDVPITFDQPPDEPCRVTAKTTRLPSGVEWA